MIGEEKAQVLTAEAFAGVPYLVETESGQKGLRLRVQLAGRIVQSWELATSFMRGVHRLSRKLSGVGRVRLRWRVEGRPSSWWAEFRVGETALRAASRPM